MESVFKTYYGAFPVRFVMNDGEAFISKFDLFDILAAGMPEHLRAGGPERLDHALKFIIDAGDSTCKILGNSEIGPAIHFFAAYNLMCLLASLEEKHPAIGSTAAHADAVIKWYPSACIEAFEFFDLDPLSVNESMVKRMKFVPPAIPVEIVEEDGIYTAVCETLGIVSEAETTDALISQVYALVPDMVELNRPDLAGQMVRLTFEVAPPSESRRRAG